MAGIERERERRRGEGEGDASTGRRARVIIVAGPREHQDAAGRKIVGRSMQYETTGIGVTGLASIS